MQALIWSWRQIAVLTTANMKARYRKTVAGFMWVVLNPLLQFIVQCAVFQWVLKIEMPRYAAFLLSGLLPWLFISQSLEMCTSLFVTNGRILRCAPPTMKPWIFIASQVLENAVSFVATMVIVIGVASALSQIYFKSIWLFPFALAPLLLGVFSASWILATLQVFFRDIRFLVSFGLQILFFLTPVFYPEQLLPQAARTALLFNPFYHLLNPFRAILYEPNHLAFSFECSWISALVLFFVAHLVWARQRKNIPLYV